MDPPTYESSSESTLLLGSEGAGSSHAGEPPPALLNLVPDAGEVSFQRGYLGYSASSIQGSLQIKFTASDPAAYRSLVDKVTVEFAGVESIKGDDVVDAQQEQRHRLQSSQRGKQQHHDTRHPLDLIRECKTLWDRKSSGAMGLGSTSIATAASTSTPGPPGNFDFAFQLTDDLPHCCHLGTGSIEYTIKATLHSAVAPDITVQTLIHLTRTSPPPSTTPAPTPQPEIYTSQHPTELSVFFPHGTSNFRRSEAIELRVRVPPPDASLVEEKGLKLRSISAELVRIISINDSDEEEPEITELLERPSLRNVISRSGKSAAFSSSRSVFLHVWLQPVDPDSCESITQTTIYNEISFGIRVTASFRGRQGDREDVVFFDRPVTIIPDYPPLSSTREESTSQLNAPAPLSRMYTPSYSAAGATSSQGLDPNLLSIFQNETEFDGYEQISEGASAETAPPSIDADQPPPSIEEQSSNGTPATAFCADSTS